MATITLSFNFSRESSDGSSYSYSADFEVETGMLSDIDDKADELLDVLNSDLEDGEDEWVFDEFIVNDYDDDFADASSFADLDDYAEYIEKCEEHGEGYVLRYADIGDFDFNDSYSGCWNSAADFVQNMIEDCYEIPGHLALHIDWSSYAVDVMMNYSEYEGNDGLHIFRE